MKDESGKLNDITLEDGMYIMIINKWPEPMNFKVEAQVKKEPWSQTFIRYVRGMDEEKPKLPLRRT